MPTKKEVNTPVVPIDPFEDKVIVNIPPPSDDEEYDDQGVFVAVNGYNAYIKYGEDVEVPRFVKEMLENRKMCKSDAKKSAKKFASKEKEKE